MKKILSAAILALIMIVAVASAQHRPSDKLRMAEAVIAQYYVDSVNVILGDDRFGHPQLVGRTMLRGSHCHYHY